MILYFSTRSDGRHDKIDKRAIFKNVINTIRDVDIIDEDNFKEKYKTLQSELKSFFVKLSKYRR